MRARTLLLLSFAIILAIGTFVLARSYFQAQQARVEAPKPVEQPARAVLVARADIGRGQILRKEDLVWQAWPEGSIDKSYILSTGDKKPESFEGWVAINPIAGGEPVTESKIISPGNRGFLAAVLRPGMRAISVPISVTSGISGFLFPGDEVDLLLTYPIPTGAGGEGKGFEHRVAETVLHNIRVIGIDQRLQSKAGEAFPGHTATFEVTPKQSEVIALATEIGKLSLTLHSLRTPSEQAAGGAEAREHAPPDSFNRAAVTYTVDSELSPLLPQFASGKDTSNEGKVTVLRGAKATSQAAVLPKGEAAARAPTSPAAEPTNSAGGT